jgi:alkylhydroperoxidase/carboxymuconolactone decarboxylase family protein YurZ
VATIKLISENEADDQTKKIFDEIKLTKQIDFVPNIWRALANYPAHLETTWNKLKTIMKPGKIDLLTKEMIALAVSITNGCSY